MPYGTWKRVPDVHHGCLRGHRSVGQTPAAEPTPSHWRDRPAAMAYEGRQPDAVVSGGRTLRGSVSRVVRPAPKDRWRRGDEETAIHPDGSPRGRPGLVRCGLPEVSAIDAAGLATCQRGRTVARAAGQVGSASAGACSARPLKASPGRSRGPWRGPSAVHRPRLSTQGAPAAAQRMASLVSTREPARRNPRPRGPRDGFVTNASGESWRHAQHLPEGGEL